MFNINRVWFTKNERLQMIKRMMSFFFAMTMLFICSISYAIGKFDSTNMTHQSLTPILSDEKKFFTLASGTLGPDRPNAGNSYWNGSRATTSKRCPSNYTPSIKLSYVASEQGGGNFYGHVVLSADFNTSDYQLYNIAAYTDKTTRNGYLTFRWVIYCTAI